MGGIRTKMKRVKKVERFKQLDVVKNEISRLFHCGYSATQIHQKLKTDVPFHMLQSYMTVNKFVRSFSDAGKYRLCSERSCLGCSIKFFPKHGRRMLCETCGPTQLSRARFGKFGITHPQFELLSDQQSRKCAICERALLLLPSKQVHVDHDHKTGKVRGILCSWCNRDMSVIDDAHRLTKLLAYKETHAF